MGLLSSHRVSRVLWYSGYLPASPLFRLRDCHSLWSIFPNRSTRNDLSFASPYPKYISTSGLGCFPFARHYLGNRFYFLFLRVLRCFTSPGALLAPYLIQESVTGHYPGRVPLHTLCIHVCILCLPHSEFPHSEIYGSKIICISP